MGKIHLHWQVLTWLILVVLISLTVSQLGKIELPQISDRDLIFWLTEVN